MRVTLKNTVRKPKNVNTMKGVNKINDWTSRKLILTLVVIVIVLVNRVMKLGMTEQDLIMMASVAGVYNLSNAIKGKI